MHTLIAWKPDTVCILVFVQKIFIAFMMAMRSRIPVSMISATFSTLSSTHKKYYNLTTTKVGQERLLALILFLEWLFRSYPDHVHSVNSLVLFVADYVRDEAENENDENKTENDEDEAENENDGDKVEAEARVLRICHFDLSTQTFEQIEYNADLEKSHISVWIMNEAGSICEWDLVIHVHARQLIDGSMIKSIADGNHVIRAFR
ncbi:hypothetical protein Tco_1322177 [Tanacetum coccineum]